MWNRQRYLVLFHIVWALQRSIYLTGRFLVSYRISTLDLVKSNSWNISRNLNPVRFTKGTLVIHHLSRIPDPIQLNHNDLLKDFDKLLGVGLLEKLFERSSTNLSFVSTLFNPFIKEIPLHRDILR